MNQAVIIRQQKIRECSLNNPAFWKLYSIFKDTLNPGMDFRVFRKYYYTEGFQYIDVSFLEINKKTVGFCAAAFYNSGKGKNDFVLARSATGILQEARGQGLPKWILYLKYIKYKTIHPLSNLVLSGYIANPLIYAMICKYTGIVYPRLSQQIPAGFTGLRKQILQRSGIDKAPDNDFVFKIHFQVNMGADILKRITDSKDIYVKYFLSINPRFLEQFGLMVIIPVTWENIIKSSVRFIINLYRQKRQSLSYYFIRVKAGKINASS